MLISIKHSLIALSCLAALGLSSNTALADNPAAIGASASEAAGVVPVDADMMRFPPGVHGIIVHGIVNPTRPGCLPGSFGSCVHGIAVHGIPVHGIIIQRQCTAWEIFAGQRHCIRWSEEL